MAAAAAVTVTEAEAVETFQAINGRSDDEMTVFAGDGHAGDKT